MAFTLVAAPLWSNDSSPSGYTHCAVDYGPLWASILPTPTPEPKRHKVVEGENDNTISKKFGISVKDLHAANPGQDWRKLQIGQVLTIPEKGLAKAAPASPAYHKVLRGEHDGKIAKKYSITEAALHAANPGVVWTKLQIGQKIKLPSGVDPITSANRISTARVRIKVGAARVRSEPTTASRTRATVKGGTTAEVLDRQGAWYKLRFRHGTVGWVRGDLLAESSSPAPTSKTVPTPTKPILPVDGDLASAVINSAVGMLGVRYRWGGTSRGAVDCSGFTTVVFARNGMRLPRTSIAQSRHGEIVPKDDLQAGDLLFFITGRATRINHVGIYMGGGKFIHSSSYKGRVVITEMSQYRSKFAGARRVPGLQAAVAELVAEEPVVEVSKVVLGADKTGKE
ncbi:MAG: C40 family peptidase [Armatimonadetes bacterium]|nr:C40 family peptidase [Armatimonadota bacterium]